MPELSDTILNNRFVQLLLESIGDGVFTLNQEGFITSWNFSMERISGYIMFKNGKEVQRFVGLQSAETLSEALEKIL